MLKRVFMLVCAMPFFICGCLPTLNPLAKSNEATPDGLVGIWARDNGEKIEYRVSMNGDHYEIVTSKDGVTSETGYYRMTVARIDGRLYANIVLDGRSYAYFGKEAKELVESNSVPVYFVFRMELEGNKLQLWPWDGDNARKAGIAEPPALGNNANVFTAPAASIREMVARNGGNVFKFNENFCYTKKPVAAK